MTQPIIFNYTLTPKSGNINVFTSGQLYHISNKHPNYKQFLAALEAEDDAEFFKLYDAFEIKFSNNEHYEIPEKVEIAADFIEYRGRRIEDPVLIKIIKGYNTKCDALKYFIDNLFLNPKWESIEQLGSFLQHNNFPLTEDGCFLGYKAVKKDFKDIYTGTIDNSIGKVIMMPRADVTFNPDIACAAGLHVGTFEYARTYGGGQDSSQLIIVKVNPAHCVSVPKDHNDQKLRCSQYTVVGTCDELLQTTSVYSTAGQEFKCEDYFADIVSDMITHKKRPSKAEYEACCNDSDEPQFCTICGSKLINGLCPQCDCVYDDEEEDEELVVYCDNCGWESDATEDDEINYCPKCGSEVEYT